MSERGRLFVFEGPDGVGKSTLAKATADALGTPNSACHLFSFPGRRRGTLGSLVYRLHHQPATVGIEEIAPGALQALHVAAHIDAIDRWIRPLLVSGESVVLDRYWWSTWVYGLANGAPDALLAALIAVEDAQWGDVQPSAVFLLERSAVVSPAGRQSDQNTRVVAYRELAAAQSARCPIVTVINDRTVAEALTEILAAIAVLQAQDAHESER